MTSRSATVLVIFIVAILAFCFASVFASMTGQISILPNKTESGGILDNLSAITNDTTDSSESYGYQEYKDYSSNGYSSSDNDNANVETTKDDSSSNNPSSDVKTTKDKTQNKDSSDQKHSSNDDYTDDDDKNDDWSFFYFSKNLIIFQHLIVQN